MANIKYLISEKIHIFPCAGRGSTDESSRFTTQYNLTHLAFNNTTTMLTTGGTELSMESQVSCVIGGYYIEFTWPEVTEFSDATELYLELNVVSKDSGATDPLHRTVASQPKLTSFGNNETLLDIDNHFKAARLTNEPDTSNAYSLLVATKSGSKWLSAQPAPMPFSKVRIGSTLYNASLNNGILMLTT